MHICMYCTGIESDVKYNAAKSNIMLITSKDDRGAMLAIVDEIKYLGTVRKPQQGRI